MSKQAIFTDTVARVFAIIPKAPIEDDEGEISISFLKHYDTIEDAARALDKFTTEWPSDAMHYDTLEDAAREVEKLNLRKTRYQGRVYPMIVELTMGFEAREILPDTFQSEGVVK